jgi:Subtilase family
MLDAGHPMLTNRVLRRAAVPAVAGLMLVAAAGTCPAETASAAAHAGGQGSPADGRAALLREMRAAWQITNGHGVTVAVLSSGVTQVHDLAGKVITGPDFAPGRRASKTEGTVLASAIAGSGPTTASPFGAIGRAPGARILAITVIGTGKANAAGTWQLDVAHGIRYAAGHGAKVIAVDYTGYPSNVTLDSAVAYAVSRGVVIVTAGYGLPKHRNGLQYPNGLPGVINTSFTILHGLPGPPRHEAQAANSSVLVTAPGNELAATGPNEAPYLFFNSGAALAWTAGTVALIKSVYPKLAPALVERALAMSAQDRPPGGYDTAVGYGLINPLGALHAAASLAKVQLTAAPGAGSVAASGHFGAGPPPGAVTAVHHLAGTLAGYLAAVLIGLACLAVAGWLARRRRKTQARGPASVADPGAPAVPGMPS